MERFEGWKHSCVYREETADGLDELGEKGSEMDSITEGMDKLSDSATTASTSTGEIASSMGELNTSTEGLSDNLNGINDALTGIPEADKFDNLTTSFTNLGDAIKGVADALGVGEEGTVGGLVSALQEISTLSLDGVSGEEGSGSSGSGIVSQFQSLKTAVEDVTSAINGGGSSGGEGGDASTSSSASMSSGATEGGAGGLTGAIEGLKSTADEALGSSGEEGEDGEGSGVIGQFEKLKKAVDDVTTSIGGGEENGESSSEEDSANLVGAITNLGTKTEEILAGEGENGSESGGVIGRFTEFKDVIGEANEHVTGISDGLAAIDGQEVECTIKVNIETTGGLPAGLAHATGTALDTMNFDSAEYNAQYGKAFASGTIGLKHDEKNALRSEYGQPELTVYPNGTTELTTSPVMSDLPKGTVIYNEEQTKKIMDNKASAKGNAHAESKLSDSDMRMLKYFLNPPIVKSIDENGKMTFVDEDVLKPISREELIRDLQQKSARAKQGQADRNPDINVQEKVAKSTAELGRSINEMFDPMHIVSYNMEKMLAGIDNISNHNNISSIINNRNVQQPVTVQIGDINLTGVQDVSGLSHAIKTRLPGMMMQGYFKN